MTSVHLRDVAECCYGHFSHCTCTYLPVFAWDLYSSWSWNTINSSTPVRYLTAIPSGSQKHAHAAWPTAMPSLSFAIIMSGLGKRIHEVIVFVGLFYSGNERWCCDRSFYIWDCCNQWVVILSILRYVFIFVFFTSITAPQVERKWWLECRW